MHGSYIFWFGSKPIQSNSMGEIQKHTDLPVTPAVLRGHGQVSVTHQTYRTALKHPQDPGPRARRPKPPPTTLWWGAEVATFDHHFEMVVSSDLTTASEVRTSEGQATGSLWASVSLMHLMQWVSGASAFEGNLGTRTHRCAYRLWRDEAHRRMHIRKRRQKTRIYHRRLEKLKICRENTKFGNEKIYSIINLFCP